MAAAGSNKVLTIGLVQMNCSGDPEANLAKAVGQIAEAARRGAHVVCLPELFRTRYFCQTQDTGWFNLAESIPGQTTKELGSAAKEHGLVIVGSIFERRAAGVFHNTAVVIDAQGELIGRYRKMHIPDDPLYYEKFYFTPGDLEFACVPTQHARLGLLVCWDQWFPEAARLTALRGAQVIVCPTAIGWHPHEKAELGPTQHCAWETVQRGHAIASGVFLAVPNRVGTDGNLEFWGASFVTDPFGRVLGKAGHDSEELLIVDCDLERIDEVRQNWPFLRDRRIDAYGGLTQRMLEER